MRLACLAVAVALLATPAFAQQGGFQMLQAMDANGDGSVTRVEAQAARAAMFDRLDSDGDDYISGAERTAANARGGQVRRGLDGADANNDGRISRAELNGLPFRGFDRLDRNHDDVLSTAEIDVARSLMQGR
jgi:hypothetical protein